MGVFLELNEIMYLEEIITVPGMQWACSKWEPQLLLIRPVDVVLWNFRQFLNLKDTTDFYFKKETRNQVPGFCTWVLNEVAFGLTNAFKLEASVSQTWHPVLCGRTVNQLQG